MRIGRKQLRKIISEVAAETIKEGYYIEPNRGTGFTVSTDDVEIPLELDPGGTAFKQYPEGYSGDLTVVKDLRMLASIIEWAEGAGVPLHLRMD